MCSSFYRFQTFLKLKDELNDKDYWRTLADAYTGSDNLYHLNEEVKEAFLEYVFDGSININQTKTETKYYPSTYLQPIIAAEEQVFNINYVEIDTLGEVVLRLGVGRSHNLSLQPTITVNGTIINVPENWRGDDQAQRDSFFGVLEIPVPYELIQSNNAIVITFPDNGGHISTVTMQVFNFSSDFRNTSLNVEEPNNESIEIKAIQTPLVES